MKKVLTFFIAIFFFTPNSFDIKPKEVDIPCKKEGMSDTQYFRASASAKSKDLAFAKEKSELLAKQVLGSLISSTIESVSNHYTANSDNSYRETFETITRESVNQQLKKVTVICQKINKTKEGYEVFSAVEMSKVNLIETISQNFKEANNDFDKEKFLQILNEETEKK